MPTDSGLVRISAGVCLVVVWAFLNCTPACSQQAQDPSPGRPRIEEQLRVSLPPPQSQHRFWDSTNAALFAGVGGARTLDYTSTRHFRNKGVNESLLTNAIVDNKPLFAAIEVAGVGASIGFSYLFHRTGHHKLERWVSIVHFSVGTAGAVRNYFLKPAPANQFPL